MVLCFCVFSASILMVGCGECKHENLSTYFYDLEYHWRVCEDCDKAIGKEKHIFEDSLLENNTLAKICKECKYQISESVMSAVLPNNFLNVLAESGIDLRQISKISFDYNVVDGFINTEKLIDNKIQVWQKENELSLVYQGKIKVEDCFKLFGGDYFWFKEIVFNNFDISNVTNMSSMFYLCSNLKTLNLANINTSRVTSMAGMFDGCAKLLTLNLSNFNTSNVEDMNRMFFGFSSLISLDITSFNTPRVAKMNYIFQNCSSLMTLNLSSFNTINVTNMSNMFDGCSKLMSLDLTSFDTSKVNDMSNMFFGCSGLSSLNLTSFDTSNVCFMSEMFYNCSNLTMLNLASFNTSKVTSMSSMFFACSGLPELNLTSFDTLKVTSMNYMFEGCENLETILVGQSWVTARNHYLMFSGCKCQGVTIVCF